MASKKRSSRRSSRRASRRSVSPKGRYGEETYRGYKLLTATVIRGATTTGYEVDVMKRGGKLATTEAKDITTALRKARRVVDAIHGD